MKQQTAQLSSIHDGLPLSVLSLEPDQPPRAVVQLVHGMAEHKERYLPFMKFLAEHGFASVIHDHRGHGASVRSPEDLGHPCQNGAEGFVEDTHQITSYIKKHFPGLPLILFGHSMGSLIVRAYARYYDGEISQLIVCGSPSRNADAALSAGRALARLQRRLFGGAHKSRLMDVLVFGGYHRKFRENLNAWICSDPEVVRAYNESDLCGFSFSIEGYLALFDLLEEAYQKEGWLLQNPRLPILFVSGREDPCLMRPAKFKEAVERMREAGYRDVSGKLYPGMRHEILNEKGKAQVYKDLLNFIERHL